MPPAVVARSGLLRPRDPDTVDDWLNRWRAEGMDGLFARDAGARPLFSPQRQTRDAAPTEVQHRVQRAPRTCGQDQTRWTRAGSRRACPWFHARALPGVHTILARLPVVWKRARASLRRLDPDDDGQRAALAAILDPMRAHRRRSRVRCLDAVTIERQPTLAQADARRGADQARAALSQRDNPLTRGVATRAAQTGQVSCRRAQRIMIATLVQFYHAIRATSPDAATIYGVQDHWPAPAHPDLLAPLAPHITSSPFYRPGNWPTAPRAAARQQWGQLPFPIQMVPVPTSASRCNPIEQRWRLLRQTVTHLHHWADDLPRLREEVDRVLSGFAGGSTDLLRSVGLSTGLNS